MADDFVARLRLQPAAKGEKRTFQLVTFATEDDCRFFYPRRALDFQRQFNTFVSRALRERYGVRVRRISLAPADYEKFNPQPAGDDQGEPKRVSPRDFSDQFLMFLSE